MIAMLDPKMFTTFVTGATSGIGEATCRRFVSAGAKVIATGRRADRLEALKAELGEACSIAALDVRDRVAVEKTVAGLPEPFRRINVVVANAGHGIGMQLAQQASIADWEDMVATNINGMLYIVHSLLAGMLQRDEGHIVLLGSIAGDYPLPAGNVYGASKAFVKQFALNLRADVLGSNVRVTNIEPGLTDTDFMLVRFGGDAEKKERFNQGLTPMTAEDIAEAIFWSCTLPRNVNINRIQMMPTTQAFSPFARSGGPTPVH
jgi:3-hydroxy acid dehydrogenase / malonic semialdehyde reductase